MTFQDSGINLLLKFQNVQVFKESFSGSLYRFCIAGNTSHHLAKSVAVFEGRRESMIISADRGSWPMLHCCRTSLRCCHKPLPLTTAMAKHSLHTLRGSTYFLLSAYNCTYWWRLLLHGLFTSCLLVRVEVCEREPNLFHYSTYSTVGGPLNNKLWKQQSIKQAPSDYMLS